jgi:hypothetical protein
VIDVVGQEAFMMKCAKTLMLGVVLALSLVGASSASAANWDPQNTTFTGTQEGHGAFTLAGGGNLTCTSGDIALRAIGAVAMNANIPPMSINGCTESILGTTATVTTFGTWNFIATSTTSVDATFHSSTGVVATFHFPGLGCDATVPSPVNIPNNTWNNTTHTLTINSAVIIPIHAAGLCASVVGTSMRWDANLLFSSNVIIT